MKTPIALAAATMLLSTTALAETLTILHTNDFHSRVEPISKYDSGCSAEDNDAGKCFGGYARLATAIRDARADAGTSILVSAGDQFQGSLFYTYYKGQVAAEMMNALGYDLMAVGNHEFNHGPETLGAFVKAVEFPVLMANADIADEPELSDVIERSVIIELDGKMVGFIGLTPDDNADLSSPGPNVIFQDPIEAVAREVAALEAAGVDRIVVLSHSGHAVDLRLAAAVDGIDVIVGGHSHTLLSNESDRAAGPYPTFVDTPNGGRTAIVQAYAYGKYLGRLNVTFDEDGVVTDAVGEPILMDASVAEDETIKARIKELAAPLDEIRNQVVARSAAPIDGSRESCRAGECEIGNLVADAMLDSVKDQGIDIAIQNGGGLRASIDAGEVTMGEILTVLPFQNVLSTFRLSGADVVAALESGVSQIEEGKGRFPQVAGLRYAFTTEAEPMAGRILRVEVPGADGEWVPIDEEKMYGVVSNNFMRGGGDGYAVFRDNAEDAYDFGPALEDIVAEYMIASGEYAPFTDGRIVQE